MKFKDWKEQKAKERIAEVMEYFDNPARLAQLLALPYSTVKSWQVRGKISRAGAVLLEQKTKGRFTESYMLPTGDEWFSSQEWHDGTMAGGKGVTTGQP